MPNHFLFKIAALFGITSGLALTLDGLLDLTETERALASLPATSVAPLGILAVTGIYLHLRSSQPSTHLDLGYAVNVVGLSVIGATAFARNFVLAPLDDDLAQSIASEPPTSLALIIGGLSAVAGIVLFGSALIRSDFDQLGSWLYTLVLPLSGFAVLVPAEVGAIIGAAAGFAVIRVSFSLYTRANNLTRVNIA